MILHNENNYFKPWSGEPINGVRYPLAISNWPASDLEAIGLWRDDMIAPADPLPVGTTATSRRIQRVNGVVKWVNEVTSEDVEQYRQSKLEELADRRWQAETGGTMVGGVPIKTDAESARKITSAYVMADKNPDFAVRWKVETGMFVTLDAATIIAIGDAVTAHVQACFDNEDVLTASILAAGNRIELDAIDINTGWPE